MTSETMTKPLRALSPHFQRSINLVYDTGDTDYVASYIPTINGVKALAAVLDGTHPTAHQRSHAFHAAYGSGKSLLGIVLNAIANQDTRCHEAISIVQERVKSRFPEYAQHFQSYIASGARLLPVILSGDEGNFSTALTKALSRSLAQHSIAHIRPYTQFESALTVIRSWEQSYPNAYQQLQALLYEKGTSLSSIIDKLYAFDGEALTLFEHLYPEITAGAQFNHHTGISLESIFHATAEALHYLGYVGIIIIWDEFGRYLESRVGEAFGGEVALLQSFAEFCNRSGSSQVHLVLITHQLISGYATGLPLLHQQEWARIAERFRSYDVSSDPQSMYQLIAEAIDIPNVKMWQAFTEEHHTHFDVLTSGAFDLSLFNELDDVILRRHLIEQAWPLHPLSVYTLPRLASRVAQNERTLFTFLAADEPGTLANLLKNRMEMRTWWTIGLDVLWDYFAGAIRSDAVPGGMHSVWSGAMYALSKVDADDNITQSLIKTMAVLLVVVEVNLQSYGTIGRIVPTNDILAWVLDIPEDDVVHSLEVLTQRRAVVYRKSDGYWTFTRGSDIDLDTELSVALERHIPSWQQIRQTLEQYAPLPYYLPRGYNQERCITRFFSGFYCWPADIRNVCTEAFLRQMGACGYADGVIVYVLTTNAAEREEALSIVDTLPSSRLLFVIPDQPLLLIEPVRELFALGDLSRDSVFMQQDERLEGEIAFFVEDAKTRLIRTLNPFLEPSLAKAMWWWYEDGHWFARHLRTEDISRLLSKLCKQWFNKTPVLNNELVNLQEPSSQQARAMEKVIDMILRYPQDALPPDLGLSGHGPDWLIVRTLLLSTKLLRLTSIGFGILERPTNNPLLVEVWDTIQTFIVNTCVENEQEIAPLIGALQSPPFGLRRGVLPLLLAAVLRYYLPVLTIRQKRRVISPLTGAVFLELCKQPEQYTIQVSQWDTKIAILWKILDEHVSDFLMEQERSQQLLNVLSAGLLRWLQSLPRYCRDTMHISPTAQRFRVLLRKAQKEPVQVLTHALPELFDKGSMGMDDEIAYQRMLESNVSALMNEIATAYHRLLYSLEGFIREAFAPHAVNGHTALRLWLSSVEERVSKPSEMFRLNDRLAQRLIEVTHQQEDIQPGAFLDQLSKAVLGITLNDWNDHSEEIFRQKLSEAKERVEREIFELTNDTIAVELSVALPTQSEQTYRFRPSNLSLQGQRILQNFKSTLETAGRSLSVDEKRQIALALIQYLMGEENTHE